MKESRSLDRVCYYFGVNRNIKVVKIWDIGERWMEEGSITIRRMCSILI